MVNHKINPDLKWAMLCLWDLSWNDLLSLAVVYIVGKHSLRSSATLFSLHPLSVVALELSAKLFSYRLVTCLATLKQKGEHLWHSQTGDFGDLPNQAF
jgi:hypothetical protein